MLFSPAKFVSNTWSHASTALLLMSHHLKLSEFLWLISRSTNRMPVQSILHLGLQPRRAGQAQAGCGKLYAQLGCALAVISKGRLCNSQHAYRLGSCRHKAEQGSSGSSLQAGNGFFGYLLPRFFLILLAVEYDGHTILTLS